MLIQFFYTLRAAKLPVSVKEYLTLLEAMKAGVLDDGGGPTVDKFYALARTALVKDEALFDKFDRAFAAYFKGVELMTDLVKALPRMAHEAARTRTHARAARPAQGPGLGRADGHAAPAPGGAARAP